MTLLQDLIDGASGNTVDVSTLLRKVKVLAARLKTGELAAWVNHELVGYGDGADVPSYRGPFQLEAVGHFAGPFQSGLQNAPIPRLGFPADLRDGALFSCVFRQAVAELASLLQGDNPTPRVMWPPTRLHTRTS